MFIKVINHHDWKDRNKSSIRENFDDSVLNPPSTFWHGAAMEENIGKSIRTILLSHSELSAVSEDSQYCLYINYPCAMYHGGTAWWNQKLKQ